MNNWVNSINKYILDEWVEDFTQMMVSTQRNIRWSTIRSVLLFYQKNMKDIELRDERSFWEGNQYWNIYPKTLDKIINEHDEFIEQEIEVVEGFLLSMNKQTRFRQRGFGDMGIVRSFTTAPDFWVTQYHEEMEYNHRIASGEYPVEAWKNSHRPIPSPEPEPEPESDDDDNIRLTETSPADTRAMTGEWPVEYMGEDPWEDTITVVESVLNSDDEEEEEDEGVIWVKESTKNSLKEIQSIIDDNVQGNIPDGVYLDLVNKMKEAFEINK